MFYGRLLKAEHFCFVCLFFFVVFLNFQRRKPPTQNSQSVFLCAAFEQDLDSSYYSDYVKSLLKKRSSKCR